MPYNPFDKPIGERLTADDLQKLIEREVAEGYFVEYKKTFLANTTIGHSIASFANTYGGWYFIGVKEENHIASEICGFSLATYKEPIFKVRDIAKTHIDPVPVFYPQVVNLGNDKSVLVVYIPGDQETPFISKDGRIYRRTYDSSNPVPETDRYTIDRLVDVGRNRAKQFEKFCRDERTFSQSEAEDGWVKLFLSPYPLDTIEKRLKLLSNDGIEQLIQLSQTPVKLRLGETERSWEFGTGNVPFNFGQTTGRSVILRQIEPTKAAFNSLTVEFFVDGRAKFFIPLHYLPSWQIQDIYQLKSPQVKQTLSNIWTADQEYSTQLLRFFDIRKLWQMIAILVSFYQKWLDEEPWVTEFKAAVIIENVWRSVPFLDLDEWGIHVQKFGLPVVNSETIRIPVDLARRPLLIPLDKQLVLCSVVSLALGLPLELDWYTVLGKIVDNQQNTNNG